MKPGDEPSLDNPLANDLVITAVGKNHAPRKTTFANVAAVVQGLLSSASSETAGLLAPSDKVKLDALPAADEVVNAVASAATEQGSVLIRAPKNGIVKIMTNLREAAKVKYILVGIGTGRADVKVAVDSVNLPGAGTIVANEGIDSELVTLAEDNDFPTNSVLSLELSGVSSTAADLTVDFVLDHG